VDHGAEDDGRNNHPEDRNEAIAEWLHRRAPIGAEMAKKRACHRRDKDLEPQLFDDGGQGGISRVGNRRAETYQVGCEPVEVRAS